MRPAVILRRADAADIEVSLSQSGNLRVSPAARLTDELRELLVSNKPELIEFLRAVERTTADLLAATMKVCDRHSDSEAARDQMRRECLELPPHMQRDLLAHFRGTPNEQNPT